MEEICKDIPGCEGKYQVSTFGRFKSLKRQYKGKGGTMRDVEERILKMRMDKWGYVCLRIGDKSVKLPSQTMHRVLAITHMPNPLNKPCVNHINGIKTDNRIENLEWCTHKENTRHAFDTGLAKVSKEGVELRRLQFLNPERNPKSKMVLNLDTGIYYDSALKAWESTNKKRNRDNFCQLIKGERRVKVPFVFI